MRALAWILPLLCRIAWAQDPGCVLSGRRENLPPGELDGVVARSDRLARLRPREKSGS